MQLSKGLYKDRDRMEKVYRDYIEILQVIDECVENNRVLTALILIYTSIDSVASLGRIEDAKGVRDCFTGWVDRWMLRGDNLKCGLLLL